MRKQGIGDQYPSLRQQRYLEAKADGDAALKYAESLSPRATKLDITRLDMKIEALGHEQLKQTDLLKQLVHDVDALQGVSE